MSGSGRGGEKGEDDVGCVKWVEVCRRWSVGGGMDRWIGNVLGNEILKEDLLALAGWSGASVYLFVKF